MVFHLPEIFGLTYHPLSLEKIQNWLLKKQCLMVNNDFRHVAPTAIGIKCFEMMVTLLRSEVDTHLHSFQFAYKQG